MEEETDIDKKLYKINKELSEIEEKITELNCRKNRLKQEKEKLKNLKIQQKTDILSNQDWSTESFTWSDDVRKALKNIFKMTQFRPQQKETINAILSKHDVLLLAPTGGGKSLCYQLPAVILPGITLVISPLVSLMDDQVWAIKKLGVNAQMLCSTTDKSESSAIYKQIMDTGTASLKILYVTPERLAKSKMFMNALQKCYQNKRLEQIAIDEVHCISSWGHDFRPDYKYLGVLKNIFPDVPLLGFTATATTKVIFDVQKVLNLKECVVFKAPFNRPNLYYHVIEKPSEKEANYDLIADLLKYRFKGLSGIIYTFSIKDTVDLTTELLQRDIKVRPYHSNLEKDQRTKVHKKWLIGEIQAVVATVAFGMGIDKPDVRFVIHHTISKSMENFYQETGRAGRDGKKAECILMYRFADMFRITSMMFTEYTGLKNAYGMIDYCINGKKCRRDLISGHFSEVWNDNQCDQMCDRCFYKDKVLSPLLDITNHYKNLKEILERAENMQVKLTGAKLVDAWFHKGPVKNRIASPPPILDRYIGEQIVAYLVLNEYFKEDFQYTAYTTNSYVTIGGNFPSKSGIKYQPGRIYELPSKNGKKKTDSDCESTSTTLTINCSNSNGKHKKRNEKAQTNDDRKKKHQIKDEKSDASDCESIATTNSSNGKYKKIKESPQNKDDRKKKRQSKDERSSDCESIVTTNSSNDKNKKQKEKAHSKDDIKRTHKSDDRSDHSDCESIATTNGSNDKKKKEKAQSKDHRKRTHKSDDRSDNSDCELTSTTKSLNKKRKEKSQSNDRKRKRKSNHENDCSDSTDNDVIEIPRKELIIDLSIVSD